MCFNFNTAIKIFQISHCHFKVDCECFGNLSKYCKQSLFSQTRNYNCFFEIFHSFLRHTDKQQKQQNIDFSDDDDKIYLLIFNVFTR